ncbi:hypothetical protein MJI69_27035, partial [Salmonella enterica subsp. enterica serovar Anatum]|nr:hypothetical protein [Salmonella enterica subsp. enterica serovar Anatum]
VTETRVAEKKETAFYFSDRTLRFLMGISLQIYRKCNKNVFSILMHIKTNRYRFPTLNQLNN